MSKPSPQPAPVLAATPLKPRKGLFVMLCVLMVLWIAALIAMYLRT
jgi:hypothetical protein